MKVSVGIGVAREDWEAATTWVTEVERLGVDMIATGETWGFDTVAPLAYFAGKTERVQLSCMMQVGARTPAAVAMTALALASMSDDRFVLGLGTSGPQVIEGWHGVTFKRAVTRLRETVEIVRLAASGERVAYEGQVYELPLPGGEGRALRSSAPPHDIPIHLATLGPRSLEITGEIADGWIASSFMAEHAAVFIDPIRAGAERTGRSLDAIDRRAGGVVQFSDDLDAIIQPRKPGFAFEIGAMGSPERNFYKDAYVRQGYGELADEVQRLWLDRRREEAAALIPDDFVIKSNLLGTDEMVKERIRAYRDNGVTTLSAGPAGESMQERLDTIGRFMDLIRDVNTEPATL
ncbi:MAG: LLM class flavin-dependent oxidoreductase [Dehalococcoidia bacterium]|jgi:F420-dependent oxidoreductase-like protein|nr:LLM class flavin-dependent oxidoreductase [Dehalococcoidia bacterium]